MNLHYNLEHARSLLAGNTATAPASVMAAAAEGTRTYHKRMACATNECVACPHYRENGSC